MLEGLLLGIIIAFVIFAVTYIQACGDMEAEGNAASMIEPNIPGMLITLAICAAVGALIGAYFNG
jgi:hypothetical protein